VRWPAGGAARSPAGADDALCAECERANGAHAAPTHLLN